MDLKTINKDVKALVKDGENEKAISLLFEAIIFFAKKKEFKTAENLREMIYEIDPLSLTEIVEASEIIEKEKNDSIDKKHQGVFLKLYEDLTPEEGNALFFAMEEHGFDSDSVFYKQGEINNKLYFVNDGSLKLVHEKGRETIFIDEVKPGEIGGKESFFKTTMSTYSLVGDSKGKVHSLKRESLDKLNNDFPGLEPKLKDFSVNKSTTSVIKEKGLNRRIYKRFKSEGTIVFQILSASGKAIGKVLKGRLADVSSGGLSFYFTTSNERNVKLLLGRDLLMKFILPETKNPVEIKKKGLVLSVLPQMNHEYSIHLKFYSNLDPKHLT